MTLDGYQLLSLRTLDLSPAACARSKTEAGFGLVGEAGEVTEIIKKDLFHGVAVDPAQLTKELGDLAWYLAAAASLYGISLDDVAAANVAKLRARYPNGYVPGGGVR